MKIEYKLTRKKPTKPGFYWLASPDFNLQIVNVFFAYDNDKGNESKILIAQAVAYYEPYNNFYDYMKVDKIEGGWSEEIIPPAEVPIED